MSEATPSSKNSERNGWTRVLGVDPAAAGPTGYGIVESDGRRCRMLHYGALKVAVDRRKALGGKVLQEVHALLCRLIEDYAPNVVAVESIFTALNVRTALRLAEVRGVVLLAAAQHGLEVYSYAPREVKASIAGHGHADKRQIQLMVRALLSMTEAPEPADAADALAVALCHLHRQQARSRFGLQQEKLAEALSPAAAAGTIGGANRFRVPSATRKGLPRILSTQ
jgi:crossover junction endodeoxyribonuclease RuvC